MAREKNKWSCFVSSWYKTREGLLSRVNHLSRAALASIVNTTSNLTLRSALSKAWPSHAGARPATVAWIVGTAQRKVSRKNREGWYLNAWNRQELQSLDRDWRKRQITKLRQSQHREKQLEFSRYFGRTSRPSSGDFKEITEKITSRLLIHKLNDCTDSAESIKFRSTQSVFRLPRFLSQLWQLSSFCNQNEPRETF